MKVRICALIFSLGLWACGDDTTVTDGGSDAARMDGGRMDGGSPDATDAGAPTDTGTDSLVDATVSPDSSLPPLEPLVGLRARVDGDTAYVTFDPIPGAVDYRIYALPDEGAARIEAGRLVAIQDGWFRCGGEQQAPPIGRNGSLNGDRWVDAATEGELAGYTRTESEFILGYGWLRQRDDAIPVYALGDPASENECGRERFNETRTKRYTSDESERTRLLGEGWRDDGVAFYVPNDASMTTPVYELDLEFVGSPLRVYYADGAEREERGEGTERFRITTESAEGMVPVYRAHYSSCGADHDELIAGEEQMLRATNRGNIPVLELQWPGLTASTVLVVEALDVGCPFQGHIATRHVEGLGVASDYPSIDEVRAADGDGQVFVNAQHDPEGVPTAIRRSFVELEPAATPEWDAYHTFQETFAADLMEVDRETFGGMNIYLESDDFLVNFYNIEPDMWAIDSVRGELWVTYSDWAADTNGKFRIAPRRAATLSDDTYLHTRMDVDIWSTGRRYPQMWITDAPWPMQNNLESGTSINIQTFHGWATDLQMQLCRNRTWDVNDQCPRFAMEPEEFTDGTWPPSPLAQEHAFPGRKARLDAYVSTSRAYLFLDGRPYGCAELPAGALGAGEVRVVFGDVLYHSGIDESVVHGDAMPFIRDHQLTETRRYFDNLGFDEGATLPEWPAALPCQSELVE